MYFCKHYSKTRSHWHDLVKCWWVLHMRIHMTCKYVNKSTYLSGPSFREVREGRTTPPPPPCDHKAKNSPQQHPPESTILHQFVAKNNKNPKGHAPRPPNLRFPFAQRQISLFKRYFTGCPIKLFGKYPINPKFDPPFKNFWALSYKLRYIVDFGLVEMAS